MEAWITGIAIWLLLLVFLAWRIRVCARRRDYVGQEITWLVYLAAAMIPALLSLLFPNPPQWASVVVLALWVVGSGVISYRLNRKYRLWVEMEKQREEEQKRGM